MPGRSVAFPAPVGNDLRWRVELNSYSPGLRPALDQLLIASGPAPVFISSGVTAALRGQLYTYNITARDPDGSAASLVVRVNTALPAWLTFTDNGNGQAKLEGTPAVVDVGTSVPVTLEALDGGGLSATQSFTITVSSTNRAPTVVAPTGNRSFNQGDAVNLNAAAAFNDPDGDVLTYSATGLPASLNVDMATGRVTGTLTSGDVIAGPNYAVVITAKETGTAALFSVNDSFAITVSAPPPPPPPPGGGGGSASLLSLAVLALIAILAMIRRRGTARISFGPVRELQRYSGGTLVLGEDRR